MCVCFTDYALTVETDALMRLSVGAQMLRAVMEELPEEGPRLVAGLHNPIEIIEVIGRRTYGWFDCDMYTACQSHALPSADRLLPNPSQ